MSDLIKARNCFLISENSVAFVLNGYLLNVRGGRLYKMAAPFTCFDCDHLEPIGADSPPAVKRNQPNRCLRTQEIRLTVFKAVPHSTEASPVRI